MRQLSCGVLTAAHGGRVWVLQAWRPGYLKPLSPLLVGICAGLKPPSPLRVGFNVAMFLRPVRDVCRPARPDVGASAKKIALHAHNGQKLAFDGAPGE